MGKYTLRVNYKANIILKYRQIQMLYNIQSFINFIKENNLLLSLSLLLKYLYWSMFLIFNIYREILKKKLHICRRQKKNKLKIFGF